VVDYQQLEKASELLTLAGLPELHRKMRIAVIRNVIPSILLGSTLPLSISTIRPTTVPPASNSSLPPLLILTSPPYRS
jgi:hypothetical protein